MRAALGRDLNQAVRKQSGVQRGPSFIGPCRGVCAIGKPQTSWHRPTLAIAMVGHRKSPSRRSRRMTHDLEMSMSPFGKPQELCSVRSPVWHPETHAQPRVCRGGRIRCVGCAHAWAIALPGCCMQRHGISDGGLPGEPLATLVSQPSWAQSGFVNFGPQEVGPISNYGGMFATRSELGASAVEADDAIAKSPDMLDRQEQEHRGGPCCFPFRHRLSRLPACFADCHHVPSARSPQHRRRTLAC